MIDGELVNFTSVILVVDRKVDTDPSEAIHEDVNFFETNYLKPDEVTANKYLSAVVYIISKMLINISPEFAWIKKVIPEHFQHVHSEISNKQTFWSYLALLPLSEQVNSDMVEILEYLNDFTLEMVWRTSGDPDAVKGLVDVVKSADSTDEQLDVAKSELLSLAKKKGLPLVIGDQLTYERAFIGKQLRKGNITVIERFDLLQLRLAMFHKLMAKVRKDYQVFLPSLSNVLDKGNLAYFRGRLSKHEITNEGSKIKKGERNQETDNI